MTQRSLDHSDHMNTLKPASRFRCIPVLADPRYGLSGQHTSAKDIEIGRGL